MSNPFDFFDKIYCINLPNSPQRWTSVSQEFQKIGILDRVERIWANPPGGTFNISTLPYPRGEFGVWLSQVKALAHSMAAQDKNFLLFEDDIKFLPNTHALLNESLKTLPTDWDIFYLGGRPDAVLTKVNEHLASTSFFYGGYAYAVNSKAFVELFDNQFNNISQPFPQSPCDVTISEYGNEHNGYSTIPALCQNVPGQSVIRNAPRDYDKVTRETWQQYLK